MCVTLVPEDVKNLTLEVLGPVKNLLRSQSWKVIFSRMNITADFYYFVNGLAYL